MSRLTENIGDFAYTYSGTQKTNKEYDKWVFEATCKLGKLEDLLEKYLIASLEDLETALKIYYGLLHIKLDYDENGKLVVKKEV